MIFDQEYDGATRAANLADRIEPRARSARYDRRRNRIVIELRNGASFLFPPELAQGLAGASPDDLARVEVTPSGSGVRWPTLDADFSLPDLMMGLFGTKAWMAALGRRGGRATSHVKAVVRENGRKSDRLTRTTKAR